MKEGKKEWEHDTMTENCIGESKEVKTAQEITRK
jgi:hypothetical protein